MAIWYLGTFPPPQGGVTVKNQNLYTALCGKLPINKIDFSEIKRKNILTMLRLLQVLFGRKNTFVIGVAGKKTRRRFCQLLYYCNRPAMKRSLIFLMGGTVSKDIVGDVKYQKYIREYKQIYVETYGMQRELEAVGLTNVGYYPNCRFRPAAGQPSDQCSVAGPLKCVFFSLIQPQKGADLIIEAAKQTPGISYAFYGVVDETYKEVFLRSVEQVKNIEYHGVFSGTPEDVYNELRKYDVLLFPTKWDTEGIPGILVETKIAGITCVVSPKSYNGEIIQDNEEGIVLDNNTADELAQALRTLEENRTLLATMKENNAKSSGRYYIDRYVDNICKKMSGGGLGHNAPVRLKTVFFARICKEKGVDAILDILAALPDVEFHFYGHIDEAVHARFQHELCENRNAFYHGVFSGTPEAVYRELEQYDLLLLPTSWVAEGVPGTLVEAKIAGLPAIVSDICYNAEIVEDHVSGIVLKENTAEMLAHVIERIDENRAELYKLKCGAKQSADRYYIENFIDDIVNKLNK